jgi:hypothetical protein
MIRGLISSVFMGVGVLMLSSDVAVYTSSSSSLSLPSANESLEARLSSSLSATSSAFPSSFSEGIVGAKGLKLQKKRVKIFGRELKMPEFKLPSFNFLKGGQTFKKKPNGLKTNYRGNLKEILK